MPDGASVLDEFERWLGGLPTFPPPAETRLRDDLRVYRALRESDRDELKRLSGWEPSRKYVVDPLAERIPGAFADLIYGASPTFTAAEDADQDHLGEMIEANGLVDALQEGVALSSGEGTAWWRIVADRSLPYPTIEWHSRLQVIPWFSGRQLRAVAFFEELERPPSEDGDSKAIWHYVEIQARGVSRNLLFRAEDRSSGLGDRRDLSSHFFTEGLEPSWPHGLDILLAGYVPNVTGGGRSRVLGRSDFHGVKDLLLELNEIASTGAENRKLTAKKRIVVPQRYLTADGDFPEGVDVLVRHDSDQDPDRPDEGLAQVEWSFDAEPLIAWKEDVEATALTRARVAPQLVGRYTEGAQTGPAFRARLLDSILAAEGKARPWDTAVPQILRAAQLVDQLEQERGGFGHDWAAAEKAPAVERADALPVDETERANRLGAEVGAEILSRQTAIEDGHPDWDPKRVEDELKRIARYSVVLPTADDPFAPPGPPEPEPT